MSDDVQTGRQDRGSRTAALVAGIIAAGAAFGVLQSLWRAAVVGLAAGVAVWTVMSRRR